MIHLIQVLYPWLHKDLENSPAADTTIHHLSTQKTNITNQRQTQQNEKRNNQGRKEEEGWVRPL